MIQNEWKQIVGPYPLQFSFLDKSFESLYRSETRLGKLFAAFSIIAIWIACLGLFGLMTFITSRKRKEIGLRKVLGASISNIVVLLSVDFIKLVVIGFVISIPISWYLMNKWLQNFAYRIEISWWIFILAGGIAFTIAIFTVGFQAVKAATTDPVKTLRYE